MLFLVLLVFLLMNWVFQGLKKSNAFCVASALTKPEAG